MGLEQTAMVLEEGALILVIVFIAILVFLT